MFIDSIHTKGTGTWKKLMFGIYIKTEYSLAPIPPFNTDVLKSFNCIILHEHIIWEVVVSAAVSLINVQNVIVNKKLSFHMSLLSVFYFKYAEFSRI